LPLDRAQLSAGIIGLKVGQDPLGFFQPTRLFITLLLQPSDRALVAFRVGLLERQLVSAPLAAVELARSGQSATVAASASRGGNSLKHLSLALGQRVP
jgi:hypothetical protein